MPRNEFAESLSMLAELEGDARSADAAIEQLRLVEDYAMLISDGPARASARYNLGRALAVKASIEGSPAALDEATDWLERSLEDRGLRDRSDAHVASHVALARVERMRVHLAADDDEALRWYRSAIRRGRELRATAAGSIHRQDVGRLAVEVAGAAIVAMRRGIEPARAAAVVWLDVAREHLTREEHPLDFAHLVLLEALHERARFSLDPVRASIHRERAREALVTAASIFPRSQVRRLHDTIDVELAWWADHGTDPDATND